MKNETDLLEICDLILHKKLTDAPIEMSISEFRRFYDVFIQRNQRQVPNILVVNLGDLAYVLFPEWSRQEFIVQSHKPLNKCDFDFVTGVDWRGAEKSSPNFPKFLFQEFWDNRIRTIFILAITFFILVTIGPSSNVYDLLNTILIQVGTVFFSIYLIFTVSQSERLSFDRKLFNSGILSKYYSDDRNITKFAILTIALMLVNTLITYIPVFTNSLTDPLPNAPGRWILASTTALVVMMLFHTFFVVSGYYLERTRDVAEREHVGNILHEEYCRHNPGANDCN